MTDANRARLRVVVRGAVQGVGFRPFVYRLAEEMGLPGWVLNSGQGVSVEVEGAADSLKAFLHRMETGRPPRAVIQSLEHWWLDLVGYEGFEIRHSDGEGDKTVLVMPDIATCEDCLADIRDSKNRRYRYPFTNCTNCGPRYSIVESLPYDRANTTMRVFEMCPECRAEYEDPADRRFHAQPNACPVCGPRVKLWDAEGREIEADYAALIAAALAISAGKIVAAKGLGGFHLMVDALNEEAVRRLRERKRREHKPLALMAPSLKSARELCVFGELEERLLASPEAPIVLLRARPGSVAPAVAPENPYLGVMLPYTPMHHLLMALVAGPVVATSGNLSDEPMCTDERDALARLGDVADLFLVHDRPIRRHADDSIVRVMAGRETVLRRARGFAPLPVTGGGTRDAGRGTGGNLEGGASSPPAAGGGPTPRVRSAHTPRSGEEPEPAVTTHRPPNAPAPPCVLAVGAHLKNAVALGIGGQAFLDRHIGDLETPEAMDAFETSCADLAGLYGVTPATVACDLHPDYLSTQYAKQIGLPVREVQHHLAHVLSCMADNDLDGEVLGVSWDGTGLGVDGTVWGGEFIRVGREGWERVGHLRTFPLPGGDKAAKEPRRSALGLLWEAEIGPPFGLARMFEEAELHGLQNMLRAGTNCPRTSSVGRLFDAVAALAGLRAVSRFEGEAAMQVEFAAAEGDEPAYSISYKNGILDWEPTIREILKDLDEQAPVDVVAARFHGALAAGIVAVARITGLDRVVLTGGCFQNKLLLETAVDELENAGFRAYRHQRVPPNDGGIALGQLVAATATWARS